MSIPRLAFLYPSSIRSFRVAIQTQRRFRHGTAVEPTDLHSSQPPPLPPAPPPSTPPSSHSASSPPPIPSPPLQSPSQLDISDAKFSKRLQAVAEDVAGIGETKKTDGDSIVQEKVKTDLSVIGNETKKSDDSTGVKPSRSFSHHFDTYSFVKRLEHSEGFTYGQSVAMMKDTRSLLELNLEDARKNFVSKSDIENEMYLFQAACSALRNEMQTKKKVQLEQLRTEQTRIQTEYDLLNQRFLGEMMALKDELNGMFHDRKMVTRAEQRAMENKVGKTNSQGIPAIDMLTRKDF
jgi:hypothetical protein